jgi:hypothetical protein
MRCLRRTPDRLSRRACVALLAAACALLAGCGMLLHQERGSLGVRNAQLLVFGSSAQLELGLDCRLSGPMQDALDHGIPVTFVIDVRAGSWGSAARAKPQVELRYFPLSRRYQLRSGSTDDVRSFATQAWLVAALGSLRINLPPTFAHLPAGTKLLVRAAIDPAALPGALRLPALFEPAWQLASADSSWPVATH